MAKKLSTIESHGKEMPGSTPFFSIGVTTYDRPELLKQTLVSIIAQTFTDFEVIVGNDYVKEPLSADFFDIRDPRIRFVNYPRNLGEAQNMNTLLDLSRGRYFTWQCDDDLYAPNFLEEVHSALIKFNSPPCVFTSYEFIYGTTFPDLAKTLSGKGQIYSGREFIGKYWSGKLKAMGCTGVYQKEYLQELGGVHCFADTHHPLYSEHFLLIQVGLQKQVVHIDKPLVLYRIHEEAWGCTTNDLLLYRQASENLLRKSITIFKNPELRDDFRQNMDSVLKFAVFDFFNKAKSHDGLLSRLKVIPFFFSLKRQFISLKSSALYRIALISWGWTGVRLAWWLGTKFDLKAAMSPMVLKFVSEFRAFFGRHRRDSGA